MNFGGIIAGALAGGAQAVGQIADNTIRQRDTENAERRRAIWDEDRANKAMDRALEKDSLRKKADAAEYQYGYDKAVSMGDENRLNKNRAALAATMPSASPETVDMVLKNTEATGMLAEGGQIQRRTTGVRLQDYVDAARSTGANPSVRADLKSDQKAAADYEKAQAKEAFDTRKQDEVERRNTAREDAQKIDSDRKDRAIVGAIRTASGGGSGSREALSFLGEERKALTADKQDLRSREAASAKSVPDFDVDGKAKALQQFKNENKEIIESIRRRDQFLDSSMDKVRDRVGLGGEPATRSTKSEKTNTISSLPAGSKQIGTKDGRPVFQSPDGKKFIQ